MEKRGKEKYSKRIKKERKEGWNELSWKDNKNVIAHESTRKEQ